MNNQQNDNFNNLVNSDVNSQSENSTKPTIYWNDQNEEAFLQEIELQNLFANTLLNDDFNDETDFNCLSLDNLQLKYTNESSSNEQPSLTQTVNTQNDTVTSSLSLISLNTQTTSNNHNDFILDSTNTFNTFNSIDLSSVTNLIQPEQLLINEELNPILVETQFSSKELVQSDPIQIQTINQDDTLFKKPNLFDSFFTSQSTVKESSSSSSSSTSSRRSTNLSSDIKVSKTKIKQNKVINLLEPIDLISHLKKINNEQKLKKEDDLTIKKLDDQTISSLFLSSTGSIIDQACFATSTSINKLFTLKRSRKRSKLLSSLSNTSKINQTVSNQNQDLISTVATQNKINTKLAKLNTANKSGSKKEKKEKLLKQTKMSSIIFEPSNKKLAVALDTAKTVNQAENLNNLEQNLTVNSIKKEDVELHIKELSLLDLHSSEDDSSELLKNLKKNLRSSSNDNNSLQLQSNKNSNYLNEIISKRIKYSPVLTTTTNSLTNDISETDSNLDQSNSNNKKERRIDKLIQYLSKSSLDSTANSISSSTSSNESLQLKKLTFNSTNDQLLQQTHTNSQNKRKKNETNDLISSSLPSTNTLNENNSLDKQTQEETTKSLSLDNDTLQHMKNLDLNLDLNINELPNNSSVCLLDPTNNKTKFKNFKKNKKTTHSVYLEQSADTSNNQESSNVTIDLKDSNSRKNLWNLLKSNSTVDEMIEEFGSELHDKISFWDLVKLKLKFSKNSQLKTTYEIIDDYTILYSNMSSLLESFVEEHSSKPLTLKKNENSSRSRSSSRNCRKQSSTAPLYRI